MDEKKPLKKQKVKESERDVSLLQRDDAGAKAIVQFMSQQGETTGPQIEIPEKATPAQLKELINNLLGNDETLPYSFYVNAEEIVTSVKDTTSKQEASNEAVVNIFYQPQAVFRVRAVSRCTDTVAGHTEAILHVAFSSNGKHLVSGSGDTTVRVWDVLTATPKSTLRGHTNWVMTVAFSPDGSRIASGDLNGNVLIWDPVTGKQCGKSLKGHKKHVTSLVWEPMHTDPRCIRVASASKDGTIKIWDILRHTCTISLSGHSNTVKCIKWGGEGLLYSASADRCIKVWETAMGKLVRTLDGHAHWVNTLSLNTEHALRTGPYDHKGNAPTEPDEVQQRCKDKYIAVLAMGAKRELLVSGSDDFTLFLWDPTRDKKPMHRLTGHQQPINFVQYAPDGSLIASASFDNSVRIWHGITGKYVCTLRGHVQDVYQVCWSGDSRLLCSSSKDSTMKVWDMRTKKIKFDLPGHSDEVYAVDWAPNGERVASGGKDKVLKMWQA